jgi:hypothetical protein
MQSAPKSYSWRTRLGFTTPYLRGQLRSILRLAARIALLIGFYMLLEVGLRRIAYLPPDSYHEPVLVMELVRQLGWRTLLIIAAAVGLLWLGRSKGYSWPQMGNGDALKYFLLIVAFILTWVYSTYEYNLFFDQGHYIDRALLIVLLLLMVWRPVFLLPWLILLLTIMAQFNVPIGGYSVAEQFQLVRMLLLFLTAFTLRLLTGWWRTADLFFVLFCLLASGYWWSGFGKIRLDWFHYGPHLNLLLPATYANGWLGFLGADTISWLTSALVPFIWPMMIFVFIIELGSLFILLSRRTLVFFLVGYCLFHTGIFLETGIFFWKWMLVEISLLILILHRQLSNTLPIFTIRHFVISLILIGGSFIWFKPVNLSWYDSAVNYVYRIEAVDVNGNRSMLRPAFFRPYDYQFTLTPFGYLVQEPQLPIVWGAIYHRPAADAVLAAGSTEKLLEIEQTYGYIAYDAEQSAVMNEFLVRFLTNWNQRLSKSSVFSLFQPPPQLVTFLGERAFHQDTQIASVTVYQVTTYFDGVTYKEIRQRPVLFQSIPKVPE